MSSKHIVFLLVLGAVFLLSCKNDEQMVQQVAYAYSYAMANYHVDEAEEYATEETRNTTLVKARGLVKAVGEAYIQSDTPAEIEIVEVEMISDTCAIATYHKTTPIKDMTGTLELRKRNGQWYAHTPLNVMKEPEKTHTTVKEGEAIHSLPLKKKIENE